MKRVLIPGLVLLAAACADASRMTGPTDPALRDHAGPDNASFTLVLPFDLAGASTATIDGYDVYFSWSWVDEDPAHDWDLVSFKVTRDGAELDLDVDNQKPYTPGDTLHRGVTDSVTEPGTYTYCVEVMAKDMPAGQGGGGQDMTFHSSDCIEVQVGASYSIEIVGGNIGDGAQGENTNNLTLAYELYYGGTIVDCTVVPDLELDAVALVPSQHNCDATTFERLVQLGSHDVGEHTLTFIIDSVVIGEHDFEVTAQGGGGPSSSSKR